MTTPIRVGGRKPAEETLREKLAFNDPDRSTPVHDAICAWLDDRLHDENFLWRLCHGGVVTWSENNRQSWLARIAHCYASNLHAPSWPPFEELSLPAFPAPRLDDLTWERAIGDERWVSGFIDIAADVSWARALVSNHGQCRPDSVCYYSAPPTVEIDWSYRSFAFEVKSSIPSLGELIRQVRYYERKHRAIYYVVAPDSTHAERLSAQGIGSVEYPTGAWWRPS